MQKCVQNDSSNGGPDAALEGAIDSGPNVGLEEAPQSSIYKQFKWQESDIEDVSEVLLDGALKYEHVSAVNSLEGTLTFEVEIKGALEVTIALHLKMHMLAGALVSTKNAKSDRIKGEL